MEKYKIKRSYKNNEFKISITLNPSSDVVDDFNDETKSPHELLLTDTQSPRLHNSFANGSSANTKFSKTIPSKMLQSGGSNPFAGMSSLFNPVETLAKRKSWVQD